MPAAVARATARGAPTKRPLATTSAPAVATVIAKRTTHPSELGLDQPVAGRGGAAPSDKSTARGGGSYFGTAASGPQILQGARSSRGFTASRSSRPATTEHVGSWTREPPGVRTRPTPRDPFPL